MTRRSVIDSLWNRIEDGPDKWKGVKCGDVLITYKMIWWDVRTSIDWLHVHVSPFSSSFLSPLSPLATTNSSRYNVWLLSWIPCI